MKSLAFDLQKAWHSVEEVNVAGVPSIDSSGDLVFLTKERV